ncbi:unnamed protein product [Pleuronectes platessa]|uniref:Uncharacterized protein n=1 Tax=Pleuronectes platessa TaxID=8262 RepID=A0A9N7YGV5_PLEPL|nr:unnamed protein product [Pleuronectes platessa]
MRGSICYTSPPHLYIQIALTHLSDNVDPSIFSSLKLQTRHLICSLPPCFTFPSRLRRSSSPSGDLSKVSVVLRRLFPRRHQRNQFAVMLEACWRECGRDSEAPSGSEGNFSVDTLRPASTGAVQFAECPCSESWGS